MFVSVRSCRYVGVTAREPRVVIRLTLPMRARGWTEENLARIGTSQGLGNAAQAVVMEMLRGAGRVSEVIHEDRDAGGAINPEQPSRRDQSRRRRGLGATPDR